MATNNAALAQRIQEAKMVPGSFEKQMLVWYQANGKRLANFAGGEEQAQALMSGLFYSASRTPQLLECHPNSLGDCLMQSAQMGLYPGALQDCAYLPFRDNKAGIIRAQFVPQYQGLVKLAYNSGVVKMIRCDVVYDADDFEFEKGSNEFLRHKPFLGPDEERGDRHCVYALIKTTHDQYFEVKSIGWVDSIRKRSKSGGSSSSPWSTDYDEMARKSILKYALKLVPKSPKLQRALDADNAEERPELDKKPVVELKSFTDYNIQDVEPEPRTRQAKTEQPQQTQGQTQTQQTQQTQEAPQDERWKQECLIPEGGDSSSAGSGSAQSRIEALKAKIKKA